MKKLLIGLVLSMTVNGMALETGDVYQNNATDLLHIMPDETEIKADITAKSNEHSKVFIEFFQTTCSACIRNRPNFIKLSNEFATTSTFKLIGIDRKESVLRSFYSSIKNEFSFPYVLDLNRAGSRAFNVNATPTSFILDSNGKILYKHEGVFSQADMKTIREILK